MVFLLLFCKPAEHGNRRVGNRRSPVERTVREMSLLERQPGAGYRSIVKELSILSPNGTKLSSKPSSLRPPSRNPVPSGSRLKAGMTL
jgi:hypothetical protein